MMYLRVIDTSLPMRKVKAVYVWKALALVQHAAVTLLSRSLAEEFSLSYVTRSTKQFTVYVRNRKQPPKQKFRLGKLRSVV